MLFYLCQALADVVGEGPAKRFGRQHVDDAWSSPPLRRAMRSLLWDPIRDIGGVAAVLRAIVDYSTPDAPLGREDLEWATGAEENSRGPDWMDHRLRLLEDYGLITMTDLGARLAVGGPALLVQDWLE